MISDLSLDRQIRKCRDKCDAKWSKHRRTKLVTKDKKRSDVFYGCSLVLTSTWNLHKSTSLTVKSFSRDLQGHFNSLTQRGLRHSLCTLSNFLQQPEVYATSDGKRLTKFQRHAILDPFITFSCTTHQKYNTIQKAPRSNSSIPTVRVSTSRFIPLRKLKGRILSFSDIFLIDNGSLANSSNLK